MMQGCCLIKGSSKLSWLFLVGVTPEGIEVPRCVADPEGCRAYPPEHRPTLPTGPGTLGGMKAGRGGGGGRGKEGGDAIVVGQHVVGKSGEQMSVVLLWRHTPQSIDLRCPRAQVPTGGRSQQRARIVQFNCQSS
jgi:hypothetical protein